jgi:protein phosphatase 1L
MEMTNIIIGFINSHQGIFDGHLGNLASKYAASSFYRVVQARLSNIDKSILSSDWKKRVQSLITESFAEIHQEILDALTSSPGGVMDESGTTATILYVTDLTVIIANVGDSRAVISKCNTGFNDISALQLTVDHTASFIEEQRQVVKRGGSILKSGGIDRVNGVLAVSRSLGDIQLAPYLSRTPHVLSLTKAEAHEMCGTSFDGKGSTNPCFIILASDGLWDVLTNAEAVRYYIRASSCCFEP